MLVLLLLKKLLKKHAIHRVIDSGCGSFRTNFSHDLQGSDASEQLWMLFF